MSRNRKPRVKSLVSLSLIVLMCGLGLAWWLSTDRLAVDRQDDAMRNSQVSSRPDADRPIAKGRQSPPSWIPSDAEADDRRAFLGWVTTNAEPVDDRGASRTWIPTDAERDDDRGAFMTWKATDAERKDDVGIPVGGQPLHSN